MSIQSADGLAGGWLLCKRFIYFLAVLDCAAGRLSPVVASGGCSSLQRLTAVTPLVVQDGL